MLVIIPFSGFYESLHSMRIDDAEKQLFSNRETDKENDGLQMRFWQTCDYEQVNTEYGKAYAEEFKDEFKIKSLKFESLNPPKEYNFTTDRIFCTISRADVRKIKNAVNTAELAKHVKENFTSRDGFISFYSSDVTAWGSVDKWDHNQLGALLQVYADQETNESDGFNNWAEYNLMEDYSGNGHLDNLLCAACPIVDRLYKIHDYLESRAAR